MSSSLLADVRPASRTVKEIPLVGMADGSNACLRAIVVPGRRDGPTVYIGAAIATATRSAGSASSGGCSRRSTSKRSPGMSSRCRCRIPSPSSGGFGSCRRTRSTPSPWMPSTTSPAHRTGRSTSSWPTCSSSASSRRPTTPSTCTRPCRVASTSSTASRHRERIRGFGPRGSYARMFATDLVMELDRETPHVSPKKLHQVATNRGTPAFSVELQQAGSIEEVSVKRGVAGFLNMFRFLGMLRDAAPVPPARQFIGTDYRYVRLRRPGLYTPDLPGRRPRRGRRRYRVRLRHLRG